MARFLILIAAMVMLAAPGIRASDVSSTSHASLIAELLRDPTPADWKALSRFDQTLTRRDFETRLDNVFDPEHGLQSYLHFGDDSVAVYPNPAHKDDPVLVLHFAPSDSAVRPRSNTFRSPAEFRRQPPAAESNLPLAGLRVVIEPADIGGHWAEKEDRSVDFRGYGRINEGDLNLIVGRLLRNKLTQCGATVFLVRDRAEPVLPIKADELLGPAEQILRTQPSSLPESFRRRTAHMRADDPAQLRIAAELLLTKTIETRARVALVRRSFTPDVTIVIQHDATPDSAEGGFVRLNRNIFFILGAYTPAELSEPEQRFRLLTKLLEDTTPIEATVAAAIAARFKSVTGFPPVLYGDSSNTRLILPGNPYVVARNLEFNREHDGPVVVTEPYFMNQPETLARLLAGDYPGKRVLAGKLYGSIFQEYADCVVAGLLDAYVSRTSLLSARPASLRQETMREEGWFRSWQR